MYQPTELQAMEEQYFRQKQQERQRISFDRRQNSFYMEGLHGYVSFKNNDEKVPKVFMFPISREGFETVQSKEDLSKKLRFKLRQLYPNIQIQCPYRITEAESTGFLKDKKDKEFKMVAQCKICTNQLVYVKNTFSDNAYQLRKMALYHVHGKDPHKVEEILRKAYNYSRFTLREGRPCEIKPIYLDPASQTNIEDFIRKLPVELTNFSRCNIVCEKYKISQVEYEQIMRNIRADYQISFRQLVDRLEKKCYTYKYLPANLLKINQQYIAQKNISDLKQNLDPKFSKKKGLHDIDELNPDIPNVLLIVTPQMKQLFHRHGQYVGFDLTFSLIKEKPTYQKEYFVGVFAGTSESRKILVFGLVLTNSQSEESYRFIIEQWLAAMGKGPESFITDEEQSLFFAVRSIQRDGLWNGQHLFDTFHILKKFRKNVQPEIFQLMRKMIHARNRYDYRDALRQALKQVHNEQQLDVLRAFDSNAQKYCFTQCDPLFIGVGISDAINQKYHDLIKAQMPYAVNYIKAVSVILDVIEARNENNKFGIIDKNALQEKMSLPFMKPYRTILSDKMFHFLLKEVYRSLPYDILTPNQERTANGRNAKIEDGEPLLIQLDKYKVIANGRVFKVHLTKGSINENRRKGGKWVCDCQFEEKSGYPCSHLIKVLMHLELDFYDNINPRWFVRQDLIDQGLLKFIFRTRKHYNFTRVKMRRRPRWMDEKDDDTDNNHPVPRSKHYQEVGQDSEEEDEDDISTYDPTSNMIEVQSAPQRVKIDDSYLK